MFKTTRDKVGVIHVLLGAFLATSAHNLFHVRASSDLWIILFLLVAIVIVASLPSGD